MNLAGWVLMIGGMAAGLGSASAQPPGFADVARKISDSVVNISTTRVIRQACPSEWENNPLTKQFYNALCPDREMNFAQRSLGSGVIIDRQGHILTNQHVVFDAAAIVVTLKNGREYSGEIVGLDPETDLAVIRAAGRTDWPAARIGDSDRIDVGDWVLSAGSPFGLEQSVTTGIISAKSRTIGAGPYDNFLQTDAAINPGNSGGPLVDMQGRVVGISTAIFSQGGGSLGIGFAIPINTAMEVSRQLIASGTVRRGWLGLAGQALTAPLAEAFGLKEPEGVVVTEIAPQGPAAKAGLRPGDILTSLAGHAIPSPYALTTRVARIQPGSTVSLELVRNGTPRTVTLAVGERTANERTGPEGTATPVVVSKGLGMDVEPIQGRWALQWEITDVHGMIVSGVVPGGPADRAGVRGGDILRALNGKPVRNLEAYRRGLRQAQPGSLLVLFIERNGVRRFVAVKVPQR